MKKIDLPVILAITGLLLVAGCDTARRQSGALSEGLEGPRSMILFDREWKFHRGDVENAASREFPDESWRVVDLPHDWSIEDIPGTQSPLDSTAVGGISAGYFVGGTGWYRKEFVVPRGLEGKRVCLLFEGVYMDADVWLNGSHLGTHPYGYTSFWYDVTENLEFGAPNQISVRVRNEGRNSRWYSGSGIYRHVWMVITEPVHIPIWATSITTPEITDDQAEVRIASELNNTLETAVDVEVLTEIKEGSGEVVASHQDRLEIAPGITPLKQMLQVPSPERWSVDSPSLYTAVITISESGGDPFDRLEETFGIRSIEFSTNGFLLNGQPLLLKGACMHHDNGPLGAAAFDRAEERRVELMKASGFNSIRCAHNPPSPAFLDACDRMGILVIDEAFDMWRQPKNPQDYHRFFDEWWKRDVESMILRDRNHPSIIMWSTGNEIPERGDPEGVETSKMLAAFIHALDPTRPVTAAVNGLGPDKDPYFATLDISGYNYSFGGDHGKKSIFETDHQRIPDRIMYCSESYPLEAFGAWMDAVDHPYVLGDYVWTGFDYLGEASIGWLGYPHEGSFYPWNHAYCGDLDICGMKRPQSFYRNVLWGAGRQLSLFVKPPVPSFEQNPDRKDWSKWHWEDVVDRWNWPSHEGELLMAEVYSSHPEVELFLNGESLGRKATKRENEWIARWEVSYEPGVLKAVAYDGTDEVETAELVTASDPAVIHMNEDRSEIRADGQDLSYITVELQDRKGNRNRLAEQLVEFEIEGPGNIVAVASSDPMSKESYQQPQRIAYQGRCLVVVRSTHEPGTIRVTAHSAGLESTSVELVAR